MGANPQTPWLASLDQGTYLPNGSGRWYVVPGHWRVKDSDEFGSIPEYVWRAQKPGFRRLSRAGLS